MGEFHRSITVRLFVFNIVTADGVFTRRIAFLRLGWHREPCALPVLVFIDRHPVPRTGRRGLAPVGRNIGVNGVAAIVPRVFSRIFLATRPVGEQKRLAIVGWLYQKPSPVSVEIRLQVKLKKFA